MPRIVVYTGNSFHYDQLLTQREISSRTAAEMIGIDFEEIKRNPQILALFIFLHEIGHARDYILNYLKGLRGNDEYSPAKSWNENTEQEQGKLYIPNCNPAQARAMYESGELKVYFDQYRDYYQQHSINSPEELLEANERVYRNLPKEKYADQFAADFIKKHRDIIKMLN